MIRTPLNLSHAKEIGDQLDAMGMHLSEYSFPNLYLFRNTHQYEVLRTAADKFYISGVTYDKKKYIMPMTNPEKPGMPCLEELKGLLATGEWDFIFPIPEEWLSCFDKRRYQSSYHLDDSDYLYYTDKIKTYPGKKMHKKKNLLNQFLRNNDIQVTSISDAVLDDAKRILELWQETSPQELSTSDYHQCMEALEFREELKLIDFIVFADSRPVGFLLGEPLNEETFTIHFAKADISFKGAYQFLFSHAALEYCPGYLYMNQEQDMGNEGLRKTKLSYRPDLMAHKYRISTITS